MLYRASPLAREAALSAGAAATVASALAWLGPPGTDLAAHAYQRALFLEHGFALWNNFWYAGRYSFVTYSLLYYPLAALLGIRLLAVATIAAAALAFAVVVWREWGPIGRWSSRSFAVVWAGIVLSAAFPFALGSALALLALWALQARAHWRFAALCLLTLLASPLAFLLLGVLLAGIAIARRVELRRAIGPVLAVGGVGAVELVLWRAFPTSGRYPFPLSDAVAAAMFCVVGAGLTWRVERAGVLRAIFLVYLVACVLAYLVPSDLGENVDRIRYAALPLALLIFALRGWRPRPAIPVVLALAISWNVSPFAINFATASSDPAAAPAYWTPAITFLKQRLTLSYRVEAVDTIGHWPAVYLPAAAIPLARGWFRQDDFPQNKLLYSPLGPRAYLDWLRGLGVRYVVLTDAPPDYSARGEAALLRGGRSGLRPVLRRLHITVFSVPHALPLVTGPGRAHVLALNNTHVDVELPRRGRYRVAIRYSPYWQPSAGCLVKGGDGMIRLLAARAGLVRLHFDVTPGRALQELARGQSVDCAGDL